MLTISVRTLSQSVVKFQTLTVLAVLEANAWDPVSQQGEQFSTPQFLDATSAHYKNLQCLCTSLKKQSRGKKSFLHTSYYSVCLADKVTPEQLCNPSLK